MIRWNRILLVAVRIVGNGLGETGWGPEDIFDTTTFRWTRSSLGMHDSISYEMLTDGEIELAVSG